MTVYYVVHKGIKPGIYNTWNECKTQITKFDNAIFKKFDNLEEAKTFLKNGFGDKVPSFIKKKINTDKKNEDKITDLDNTSKEKVYIYTDGSCIRKHGIAVAAGYGIYIPHLNVKASVPMKKDKLTNNRAEMLAIINSVNYLDEEDLTKKICIFTDSQYSMYIFDKTGQRYKDDGYKKDGQPVPNIDLIERMLELKANNDVILLKVRAHTDKKDEHSIGNSIADKLAGQACFEKKQNSDEEEDDTNIFLASDFNNNLEEEEQQVKNVKKIFLNNCKIDENNKIPSFHSGSNIKKIFLNNSNNGIQEKDEVIDCNKKMNVNKILFDDNDDTYDTDNNKFSNESENNSFMNKFKKKGFTKTTNYSNDFEDSDLEDNNDNSMFNKLAVKNYMNKKNGVDFRVRKNNCEEDNDNISSIFKNNDNKCYSEDRNNSIKSKKKFSLKNGNLMNWVVKK